EPATTGAGGRDATVEAASTPASQSDLTVRLAHNLREGRISVTMDGKSILSEPVTGERSHMRMQGALSRHIRIPSGRHTFKVTVSDDGGRTWSATGTHALRE